MEGGVLLSGVAASFLAAVVMVSLSYLLGKDWDLRYPAIVPNKTLYIVMLLVASILSLFVFITTMGALAPIFSVHASVDQWITPWVLAGITVDEYSIIISWFPYLLAISTILVLLLVIDNYISLIRAYSIIKQGKSVIYRFTDLWTRWIGTATTSTFILMTIYLFHGFIRAVLVRDDVVVISTSTILEPSPGISMLADIAAYTAIFAHLFLFPAGVIIILSEVRSNPGLRGGGS